MIEKQIYDYIESLGYNNLIMFAADKDGKLIGYIDKVFLIKENKIKLHKLINEMVDIKLKEIKVDESDSSIGIQSDEIVRVANE